MFEKKQLERFTRRDRDVVLDVLKKGVSQLTRLRHPKILSILHPLEDSRFFQLSSDIVHATMIWRCSKQCGIVVPVRGTSKHTSKIMFRVLAGCCILILFYNFRIIQVMSFINHRFLTFILV